MDGWVLPPLGLTQEDLDALSAADGVEDVEGAWSVDATAVDCIVSVRSMPERLNLQLSPRWPRPTWSSTSRALSGSRQIWAASSTFSRAVRVCTRL